MRSLVIAILLAASCSHHAPISPVRFRNAPPVWRVDDRRPLAAPPSKRRTYRTLYKIDGFLVRRTTRALELRRHHPAEDVNSLGEVPDSTWFKNRIGARDLTIEELKRGPNVDPSPFDHRPWTITGAKIGGRSLGFTFEDRRGDKYLLKFDMANAPEMETGAHTIVHRILWALGYHVPQDYLGHIRREDLIISDKAKKSDIDDERLDEALKTVAKLRDGRIRVLASRFIPGKLIGPYAREGVRHDDPNDVIPHENRRSLRGQHPIFAWLNHMDIKDDNTVDTFVNGHVVHYLIDFGKALGVMRATDHIVTAGYTYQFDARVLLEDLLGFGLVTRPWDNDRRLRLRGVGIYEVADYDPGTWKPMHVYWPLKDKDRFDAFWGAKLLMRLKPQELAAIVEEAQFSDPRSAAYLTTTLIRRQRITARYWFDRVAPLDAFTVEHAANGTLNLCFTDLAFWYRLDTRPTTYALDAFDHDANPTAFPRELAASNTGRTCTLNLPRSPDGYTIVRLRVRRGAVEMPAVEVHLGSAPSGHATVIGLRRH
jgi:hypothetical protein